MVDLRYMRHFVAVAEELHFGRAARRLNMAQPPLSQSIRRLEEHLGFMLLARSKRSVELTAPGYVFLKEARRTLNQAALAEKLARREAERMPEIRIGFIGPALYRVLPRLLVHHRIHSPGVHARLLERTSREQIPQLASGDLDIGFVVSGTDIGECESMIVERAATIAAVPSDGRLGKRRSVSLAEIAEEPFILPPVRYVDHRSTAMAVFEKAGLSPSIAQEAVQTGTSLSLVAAGLGCSLTMATAVLTGQRNVSFLAIEGSDWRPDWELRMIWSPRPERKTTLDFLQTTCRFFDDTPGLLNLFSLNW